MIEEAVYSWLNGDAAVSAIAGDRIFVDLKDDDSEGAYVVLTLIADPRPLNIDLSESQRRASIQVDCYAASPNEVRDLGEAVIDLFHGQGAVIAGHNIQVSILQSGPRVTYEEHTGLRRWAADFSFNYH